MPSLITRSAAAAVTLTLVAIATDRPATAATAEDTRNCNVVLPRVSVDPPFGLQGTENGVFHSLSDGTIDCDGTKGTVRVDGRYGTGGKADCVKGGDGWGVLVVKLGDEVIYDTFTAAFGANVKSQDTGHFHGERIESKYLFLGTKGTCATGGISEGRLTAQAKIHPAH